MTSAKHAKKKKHAKKYVSKNKINKNLQERSKVQKSTLNCIKKYKK